MRPGASPQARKRFEFVIRFYPDYNATVFASLASVYLNLGDAKAADAILRKGRRVFPGKLGRRRGDSALVERFAPVGCFQCSRSLTGGG